MLCLICIYSIYIYIPSQSCQQDLIYAVKSQEGMRTGGLPILFPGWINDMLEKTSLRQHFSMPWASHISFSLIPVISLQDRYCCPVQSQPDRSIIMPLCLAIHKWKALTKSGSCAETEHALLTAVFSSRYVLNGTMSKPSP